MTIDLDQRRAIRHPDLIRLVRAVLAADEHDEADWIEWKSALDLTTKEGCFTIARTILGMANRLPESASKTCEGLGYVVVGAEPGQLLGITTVDPANFDQLLVPYLGGPDGPRYSPNYVTIDNATALVITVEAPEPGDRIFSLRRSFNNYSDGTVFVRKHGRTAPADSRDIDALQARLVAAVADDVELDVSLVGDVPLSWFDASTTIDVIDSWISDRRQRMETAAQTEERRRRGEVESSTGIDAGQSVAGLLAHSADLQRTMRDGIRLSALSGLVDTEDTRTLEQYLQEVDTWATLASEQCPAVLAARYLDARRGLVAVQVHNPSGRYLSKVEVEVHFDWEPLTTWERRYDTDHLPSEPRPYGQPKPARPFAGFDFPDLRHSLAVTPNVLPPARSWIEQGSVRIVFAVGDLRQEGTDESEDHYLILPARPVDGVLRGTWKATVPDVYGVLTGTIDVPVNADPVDLRHLLENKPTTRND